LEFLHSKIAFLLLSSKFAVEACDIEVLLTHSSHVAALVLTTTPISILRAKLCFLHGDG
jgi:hypothetical protein